MVQDHDTSHPHSPELTNHHIQTIVIGSVMLVPERHLGLLLNQFRKKQLF